MSETDPYAAKELPNVEEAKFDVSSFAPAGEPEEYSAPVAEEPVVEEPTVPEGSIKEILAWVGEDTAKAKLALATEEDGENRKTLVTKLNEIIK